MGAALLLGLGVIGLLAFTSQASANVEPRLPQQPKKPTPKTPVTVGPYAKLSKKPIVTFSYRQVDKIGKKSGKKIALVYVVQTPSELKAKAEAVLKRPLADSAFVLATVIASEVGGMHPLAKIGVGHAAWNASKAEGLHLPELVLRPSGGFAAQTVNSYASTRQPPTLQDIVIAEDVLADRVPDPTLGATQWDSPAGQDKAHDSGDPMHPHSAADIEQIRRAANSEPVYLTGINPRSLRFWRPIAKKKEEMVS